MLRIQPVALLPEESEELLRARAAAKAGIPEQEIRDIKIVKKSVDARDKQQIRIVYVLDVAVRDEKAALRRARKAYCGPAPRTVPAPERRPLDLKTPPRVAVVGLGPAGLFAALALSQWGLRPLVLERGQRVEERGKTVERFFSTGELDPESNIQFGEGGAGAFSDGKLTTGIKDPRCREVLETLVRFGAPEEILYLGRPHIGTDRLPRVVKAMRGEIERLGGCVRFGARFTGIRQEHGILRGIFWQEAGEERQSDADAVLLAIGHSAEDTQSALLEQGLEMAPKAFSVGFRIEHPQAMIDRAQYGRPRGELPPAEYHLSTRCPDGRGVYTFCMCPGGQVVAAASRPGGVCVNGMSPFLRDGENSNAAVLVDVRPEDFPDGHPLSGYLLQRSLERRAFALGGGGYRAPAQRAEDFLLGRTGSDTGSLVKPTYRPGVVPSPLHEIYPAQWTEDLRFGLRDFSGKLKGFAHPDALLTGVETRSSCPVRVFRDERGEGSIRGVYPCGEGAGRAGGIMSAAVDGLRQAEAIVTRWMGGRTNEM